jgi:putative transposase
MSHAHVSVSVHFVFSTKDRDHRITRELEGRLWGYLAATARSNGLFVHAVGGYGNHVHVLADLCATQSISETMKRLKQASSRWIRHAISDQAEFGWQPGFGAFGVSPKAIKQTVRYIENQYEHHRVRTFQEEFARFLQHYQIPHDPEKLWR